MKKPQINVAIYQHSKGLSSFCAAKVYIFLDIVCARSYLTFSQSSQYRAMSAKQFSKPIGILEFYNCSKEVANYHEKVIIQSSDGYLTCVFFAKNAIFGIKICQLTLFFYFCKRLMNQQT